MHIEEIPITIEDLYTSNFKNNKIEIKNIGNIILPCVFLDTGQKSIAFWRMKNKDFVQNMKKYIDFKNEIDCNNI